ncbi:glutamate racemase [Tistlia consotensis]|uniref:Glutamate racemase n=1 Tax=Tistlia consotensis USBA 355 TaxID=560819 RepID=A0A1Y6BGC6_9PROT|nr:glutamate racemase [Tistlia consotensis]SMF02377.1 glutamate racemase [Tistlia consotensis USBA 355]SNS26832.1 glutamate racemase [Tistlia consotensis]
MEGAGLTIALLDSGVGGLSVLRAMTAALPDADILYLADFAGLPYGAKSDAELAGRLVGLQRRLAAEAASEAPLDALVVACNTASTLALEALRAEAGFPVVGTVPPIKTAAEMTRSGVIGLLATAATVRRPYVDRLIAEHAARCRVVRVGAAGLVPLAEAALRGSPPDPEAVARELAPLAVAEGLDAVALGCTHYPLLAGVLAAALPGVAHWIDAAPAIARQLCRVLAPRLAAGTDGVEGETPRRRFLFTGPAAGIEGLAPALAGYGFAEARPLGRADSLPPSSPAAASR